MRGAQPLKAGHSNRIFFITDALSTVRDVVNSVGEVKARYEFAEYGARLAPSMTNTVESQKTFVGGLSVQDEVVDTGLMMMGHRFYDPSLGRFLSRDPIGFAEGMNLYSYGNSPVTTVDPAGLWNIDWDSLWYDTGRALEWVGNAEMAWGAWTYGKGLATMASAPPLAVAAGPAAPEVGAGLLAAGATEAAVGTGMLWTGGMLRSLGTYMQSSGKPCPDIALGKDLGGSSGMKGVAQSTGSAWYKQWAATGVTRRKVTIPGFGRAFNQAIKRAKNIHFSLDGILDPIAAARKGKSGFTLGNMTNAELSAIKENPAALLKTIFYRDNVPVPSPFD